MSMTDLVQIWWTIRIRIQMFYFKNWQLKTINQIVVNCLGMVLRRLFGKKILILVEIIIFDIHSNAFLVSGYGRSQTHERLHSKTCKIGMQSSLPPTLKPMKKPSLNFRLFPIPNQRKMWIRQSICIQRNSSVDVSFESFEMNMKEKNICMCKR